MNSGKNDSGMSLKVYISDVRIVTEKLETVPAIELNDVEKTEEKIDVLNDYLGEENKDKYAAVPFISKNYYKQIDRRRS